MMFLDNPHLTGSLNIEPLAIKNSPGSMLDALSEYTQPVFLDSSAVHDSLGRYSVLTCRPMETISARDGVLIDSAANILADQKNKFWSKLDQLFTGVSVDCDNFDLPYGPGWFGFLGYELGRNIEKLPAKTVRDTNFPDMAMGFYDAVLVYDAIDRKWFLAELKFSEDVPSAGKTAKILREIIRSTPNVPDATSPVTTEQAEARILPKIDAQPNFTPDEYLRAVARCVEYIAAGDIFQVNYSLSQ